MAVERTLTIIKPDAVAKGVVGQIIDRFERAGLDGAGGAAGPPHADPGRRLLHRPQGPALLPEPLRLHDPGAVSAHGARGRPRHPRLRDLMGATDPAKAAPAPSAGTSPPPSRPRRPRFRLSGIGGVRDPVLLRRDGDPASLTRDPGPASADPLTFPAVLGTRQRIWPACSGIGLGFGGPFALSVVLTASSGDPAFVILPLPFLGALWVLQGLAPPPTASTRPGWSIARRLMPRRIPYPDIRGVDRTPRPIGGLLALGVNALFGARGPRWNPRTASTTWPSPTPPAWSSCTRGAG